MDRSLLGVSEQPQSAKGASDGDDEMRIHGPSATPGV